MDLSSNRWFSQIAVSNQTYVSLDAAVVDANGHVRTFEFPTGVVFPMTSTNLSTPAAQWQAVGQTNPIGNCTFTLPFNPAAGSKAFYRICAQLDPNFDPTTVALYFLVVTNLRILTDQSVTLNWTNSQPGQADEMEAIVEVDAHGHAYLVDSVTTSGSSGSFSFDLNGVDGLTFTRYTAPAATPADLFFLPTNYFNSPDVVTVPYVIIPDPGRSAIIQVAVYDMTDPNNPQFLAQNSGNGCGKGTLEIPGMVLQPGSRILEF
jgi:hypothetical protein